MSSTYCKPPSVVTGSATSLICVICSCPLLSDEEKCESNQSEKDEVSALTCGHVFHNGCVVKWLQRNRTCPNCRQEVTEEDIVPKLYFSSDNGEAEKFEKEYAASGTSASASADLPWYEKYKEELLVGGGVVLGALAGILIGGAVGGSKNKDKTKKY